MKLYSVFDLYVVTKNNIKFICKKGRKSYTYVELFTNDKIEINNIDVVEYLCKYFSQTEVTVYRNRKSKKQLLLKYIELNNKENKILIKK